MESLRLRGATLHLGSRHWAAGAVIETLEQELGREVENSRQRRQ